MKANKNLFNLKEKQFLRRFDKCIEAVKKSRLENCQLLPSNIYEKIALQNSRPCRFIQFIIDADTIHQKIKP